MIRYADLHDLDALEALERASFTADVLSRRQFRYLLTRGRTATLVETQRGRLRGFVLLGFRRDSSAARVLSIVVAATERGRGIGRALLAAAERSARERGCDRLRSEVRGDNEASLALFAGRGFLAFGAYRAYYKDGQDAVRLQKRIA